MEHVFLKIEVLPLEPLGLVSLWHNVSGIDHISMYFLPYDFLKHSHWAHFQSLEP